MRHWSREGPPAYIAVAAYLGFRRSSPNSPDPLEGVDLARFLGAFPGGAEVAGS
jgi:hypothetical protein